jgi:hypothetical protein
MRMLVDSCDWTWAPLNGQNGYKLTSRINGNTLFLPATGYRNNNVETNSINTRGTYRTSQLVASGQKKNLYLNFESSYHRIEASGEDIYLGESIRPVISSGVKMTDGTLVQVMTDGVDWNVGETTAVLHGTLNNVSKSKTPIEAGFVVGETPIITMENGTKLVGTVSESSLTATYSLPKDAVYYYRAYLKTADDSICYANTLQFGLAYVDLGLPSGTKWANINVGASSPDKEGDFFAFAETTTKSEYKDNATNYKWYQSSTYLFPEKLHTTQATHHDAASMSWGDVWMLPTDAELSELMSNCTFIASSMNGMKGYKIKSNLNGDSIFIPAVGYKRNTTRNEYYNHAYISSSVIVNNGSNVACIIRNNEHPNNWARYDGVPARPVYKTNATSAAGTPMYVRTIAAVKVYDGTLETDTLRGVVRGLEKAGEGNTFGFRWWKDGDVEHATTVPVTPETDGHIKTVISGLEPGVAYRFTAYIDNGTDVFTGDTLRILAVGAVDLGLSVKWANVNIGAENEYAEGEKYRWGGKVPYRNTTQQYTVNRNITPDSGYDIAANVWGSSYRMPTLTEIQELINDCSHTKTTINGMMGYLFTGKKEGYTDRSIFIPAAGYYYESRVDNYKTYGDYWTSTVNSEANAYGMRFYDNTLTTTAYDKSRYGLAVRPVQEYLGSVKTLNVLRNVRNTLETDTLVGYVGCPAGTTLQAGFVLGDSANINKDNSRLVIPVETVDGNYIKHTLSYNDLDKTKTYYYRAYITDGVNYKYCQAVAFELLHFVDLGLPSGNLWSNINVGASSSIGTGDYFSWGDTKPKATYGYSSSKYYNTTSVSNIAGRPNDDAAMANMGRLWITPKWEDFKEVFDNCDQDQVTINGMNCWKFTNKNDSTKYILLPKAGKYEGSNYTGYNSFGLYMSCQQYNSSYCNDIYMPSEGPQASSGNKNYKGYGMTVRPILNATDTLDAARQVFANLETESCTWTIGASTAVLKGRATVSEPLSGLAYGFIVGTMAEVDTKTPAAANVVTASNMDANGNYSIDYSYNGGNKFFRAFVFANGKYVLGNVKAITAADLLDIEFLSDGSPINATSTDITGKKYGSPTVEYNADYGRYEANLSANTQADISYNFYSFYYGSNSTVMNKIADGFTLEALIKVPAHANNKKLWAVGSQESGGTGIGVVNDDLNTETYINGAYRILNADMTGGVLEGHYYHVVTTWDKAAGKLRLYVDGEEKSSMNTTGNFRHPQSSCYYYCVGGHPRSNATDRVEGGWNGSVSFARLYDDPLTAEQIKALYDNLSK